MIEQLPVESYTLNSSSDRSPAGYVVKCLFQLERN